MADQEQEQNRSEQATPFKLEEARKRGVVSKSTEMNTVLVTLAFVALLFVGGRGLFERQLRLDAALLSQAHRPGLSEEVAVAWLSGVLLETLALLAPVFAVIVVAGVLASLAQTGPVFSFEPLKPDFDRINPASGLKRLFSMRLVFEAVKSVIKLALFGAAIYLLLDGLMPFLAGLVQTDPLAYARIGLDTVAALLFKLALVMLAIALLDFGYVRWDFAKRMMMSRREMREEHKRREGDPKVRARIRELQREMRKRAKALRRVPEADVLITNPTHVAVALCYRAQEMRAPQVLAKGAGELAARMKLLARRHGVPVIENRPLARQLFLGAELDAPVPQQAFAEVARVLAWVYALREMKHEGEPAVIAALRKIAGDNADLALIALVIGILTILFVPVPTQVLDLLLIANLAFALLILLITFYTLKPVEFSTFPSLLLIATLFRLSLNIAATRLILSQADAGKVIGAVGSYVVAGNYVTGLIVFLILIVVQYVVVTNGAQRVAEVAARFTLDSMPGQQMAIDADLNMGFIDQKQAQERRKQLEREANFYGSMDGASKFVKGDAIAGIIILLINIIGGLAIGVFQLNMPWREAVQTYTLLTIGDGIVTQIPALIISIGTGIIITRSATDARLSSEIATQFTNYPKTLFLVLAALVLLLFLPGIPAWPILIIGPIVGVLGWMALRRKVAEAVEQVQEKPKGEEADLYASLAVDPLEVAVGQNLVPLVSGDNASLMDRIVAFRKQYAQEAGFIAPKVRIRDDKRLRANGYEVRIFGVAVGAGELLADRTLAIHPGGGERRKLQGVETRDPTYGLPAVWIAEAERAAARSSGYTMVDPTTVFVTHLGELVRQNAATLLTRAETERLVDRLRPQHAGLLDELVPNVMTLGEIQKVLQNLLREKVSIRNLESILEVLAETARTNKNPEYLTELARQRLGLAICQSLADPTGNLYVLTLDPSIEHTIASSVRTVDEKAPSSLVLEPRFAEQVLARIGAQVERMIKGNAMPVLLCSPELRRHLRKLTERVLPHLAVVSMSEVPNNVNLKSFGVVTV